VSTTSYTPSSNLAENTTYYWRVRAESSCGSSNWSSVWSFATGSPCTTPSAPSLISPVNYATNSDLRPTFSWSSASQATSYTIQASTSSSFSSYIIYQSVSTVSYTSSSNLVENTTYYWRVRAESSCGNSEWSSTWSFTTGSSCPAPSAPSLISPPNNATDIALRPTFSWSSVSGATSYTIQVSISSSFSTYVVSQPATVTFYTLSSDLTENTMYYWRVRAESSCGSSEWSKTSKFKTSKTPCPILPPPVATIPDDEEAAGKITLSWDAVDGADSYNIQISTTKVFSPDSIVRAFATTSSSANEKLPPGNYYWRVRAENKCGSGDWSDIHRMLIVEKLWYHKVVENPIFSILVAVILAIIGIIIQQYFNSHKSKV
jgi:fibronectin type 3 domain-containing protein